MTSGLTPRSADNAIRTATDLRRWFLTDALPLWATHGVDLDAGGFFEKLDHDLAPTTEPRRARLVARQIYVFSAAARLGWDGPARDLMLHGMRFLLDNLVTPEGRVLASCQPDGTVVDDRQHLYDAAFVLFSLAQLGDLPEASEAAHRIADRLTREKAHPIGGYIDEIETGLQCANPHMHLFEAFLAWAEVPGADVTFWMARARDIAHVAMTRMILPQTGALPEHFDADWIPVAQNGSLVIEPGHQFEWSWLLLRWAHIADAPEAAEVAGRLAHIGEIHGVDPNRDVAFHAVDQTMTPLDPKAKLWPQTERAKAWHAQALTAKNSAQAAEFRDRAVASIGHYLTGPRPGLWYEVMDADGCFANELVKASSGYHVICALETICSTELTKGISR